jgi:hypothetical protein
MLHKTALCYPLPVNVEKYKTYRNLYNTVLRQSKTKYFDDSLNENVKNPKKTWEILKEKITVDGKQISDPSCIVDEFNKFFTSIGNSISNSVRPTSTDPISLMPDNPNVANLNFEQFGPSHLCDGVKSFETKNSCDLDGISTKLLKHIILEISHPLSHIFNLSLSTGTFPSMLNTSRTVPIFKAGSPLLCDNYRPISLLSTLSKLL